MKKVILCLTFIYIIAMQIAYAKTDVFLKVNNEFISIENGPYIENEIKMLPAEELLKKLGYTIEVIEEAGEIYVLKDSGVYILNENSKDVLIDEVIVELREKVKKVNGIFYVSSDFFNEVLNVKFGYDEKLKVIYFGNYEAEKDESETKKDEKLEEVKEVINKMDNFNWKLSDIKVTNSKGTKSIDNGTFSDADIKKVYKDSGIFKIEANKKISKVKATRWKNYVILDIENAIFRENNKTIVFEDTNFSGAKISQYGTRPNVVRVVFNVKSYVDYNISLDDDMKTIIFSKVENRIKEISYNKAKDEITVEGILKPVTNIKRYTNPERIIINFEGIKYSKEVKEALVDSQNIDKVIYKNGAIEVYLKNQSTYLVGGEGNKTNISFMKDIQEKLEYKDGIVIAKNGKNIDLNKVKFEENPYINLTRVILNDNYSSILKSGSLNINDTKTKKIDIKNISGKTTIEIYGNDLYVYKITEDEKNVYIKAFKPKDIYKNVIIIDAGHGGKDPGAVSGKDTENEYNMKIMNNLKEMLTKENIKVYYTREIDIFKTLDERVQLVNKIKPDMFLSIHNNTTFSKKIKGTEVLYYPGTMNKKLAEVIQKNVVKYANTYNRGIKQRDRLYILKHSKYPSVIAEIAYMSNVEDKKKLDTDSFLKSAAEGLYRGIKEYLKIN